MFHYKDMLIGRLEVFLAVVNLVVMVTALVGGILMCISVIRLLRKKLPSNIFILSLVLSDLLLCMFQLPVVVSSLLNERMYVLSTSGVIGKVICNISGVIYFCVRQVSFFAVISIALDRYGALYFPLRYKTILTYRRSCFTTVISWLISITIAIIPYFYWKPYVYNPVFIYCMWDILNNTALKQYVYAVFVPTFVLSNIILGFTSIANIVKLQNLHTKGRANNLGNSSSLLRAARTALIVVFAFTICYLPRYVLVFFVDADIDQFWFYYRSCAEMVIYVNSAVNPLIYIFRSRQFIHEIAMICHMRVVGPENGRYHSMPLATLASKTTGLLALPRQAFDRARIVSPLSISRHSRLEQVTVAEQEV